MATNMDITNMVTIRWIYIIQVVSEGQFYEIIYPQFTIIALY